MNCVVLEEIAETEKKEIQKMNNKRLLMEFNLLCLELGSGTWNGNEQINIRTKLVKQELLDRLEKGGN